MRGGGGDIGDRHRIGIFTRGDESRHVGHVHKQVGAHAVGDIAETLPVHHARIGRKTGHNHLRLVFFGQRLDLGVIDFTGAFVQTVLNGIVEFAGRTDMRTMSKMPAVGQAHTKNGVASLQQRQINRGIGLGAGMGLHIGIIGTEQLFGAVDGQLFRDIDVLTATVIPFAGITFRVFIGQQAALGLHHPWAGVVFGGDKFDVLFLTDFLCLHGGPQFVVETGYLHIFTKHFLPLTLNSEE